MSLKTRISDDHGIEIDHDCECSLCHKATRRIDLDLELPYHLDCSERELENMNKPHKIAIRSFMEILSSKI